VGPPLAGRCSARPRRQTAKSAPLAEAREHANVADRKLRKLQHNSRLTEHAYKNHKPVDSRMILDVS
jgi:hypothetical protein